MYFNQLLLGPLVDLELGRLFINFFLSLLQFFGLFGIGLTIRNFYLCLLRTFLDDILIKLYGNGGVFLEETAIICEILKGV